MENGLQEWSAPATGAYHVSMCRASGGDGRSIGDIGGKGARMHGAGAVYLDEGTKLTVLVGQQ